MLARFITFIVIAVLALPATALTQPAATSQLPWGEAAVAKGKKHKKGKQKNQEPQFTTVTRTVRGTTTETFISTAPIAFTVAAPGQFDVPASPYPAALEVSGFRNGVITDVNVMLTDFTNNYASDVGVLLSHDDGRRAVLMRDVGDGVKATDVGLMLDDEAAAPLSRSALNSGTFQPSDFDPKSEDFPAPAPQPNGRVALSTFDGADPNGTWHLWVVDSADGDPGDIGGWALEITAEVDVATVNEQVPVPGDQATTGKRPKKGKKRR